LNLARNLNNNFNRLTAFVLVCAACLLGANSALGARRGANDHAAQSPGRSTGSFESLRILIGRWVKNLSDFVVAAALSQACQVIEQQMVLKLCLEDSMALAETFITEPEPNKKAIEAAQRYQARMGQS